MISELSVDQIMINANKAFQEGKNKTYVDRSTFLYVIAEELILLEKELVPIVVEETALPEARIKGELQRTVSQLKSFSELLRKGDWLNASIDTAQPQRQPVSRPDIRKTLVPMGPIVVFGASNFPLAFSTAGGDTAAALAAGCSVIVKSHPAHPGTSRLVAQAITRAAVSSKMPTFIFQHIEDSSIEVGIRLVNHSLTKGVAFTGSFHGGKALFDLANKRKEPIPVFAEMGSINPVIVLPGAIKSNKQLAEILGSSILLGVGQFCTNPGLILVEASDETNQFIDLLRIKFSDSSGGKMLHSGIASNYKKGKQSILDQTGVESIHVVNDEGEPRVGYPAIVKVNAEDFINNNLLSEEVFGPFSMVVICKNQMEIIEIINSLPGQLTSTIFGEPSEIESAKLLVESLQVKCGRMILNGVPTGVEVCKSMHHGGPFPATTDSRFTSVGVDSIYRFVRPVSFQNFPDNLLPLELKNNNPLGIFRCIDNEWTRNSIDVT